MHGVPVVPLPAGGEQRMVLGDDDDAATDLEWGCRAQVEGGRWGELYTGVNPVRYVHIETIIDVTMPWQIVHISETPPEGKPWIISSRSSLAKDAANRAQWKAKWRSEAAPYRYTGEAGSFAEKLAWSHAVVDETSQDFDLLFDRSRPHDEGAALGLLSG